MFFFTVYEFSYFLNIKFEMYTYKHMATFSERYKNKRDRNYKHTEIRHFPFRFLVYLVALNPVTLKGLCHEMNIVLKAYNNKLVLCVQVLIFLTIFCFLVEERIKLKVLACSFEITY